MSTELVKASSVGVLAAGASPVLPVLVEATVRAPLTVSPKVIAMGTLKVNEEKTQKVLVGGNQPFTIVGIDGLGDGVTAELPRGAQRVHHLTIKCQPTRAGALKKQLTIRTNLDQGARETITVEADVSP